MKEMYEPKKAESPAISSCTNLSMDESNSKESLEPDDIQKQIAGLIKYDSSSNKNNTLSNDSPFVHNRA
jgi:hypothetical protein